MQQCRCQCGRHVIVCHAEAPRAGMQYSIHFRVRFSPFRYRAGCAACLLYWRCSWDGSALLPHLGASPLPRMAMSLATTVDASSSFTIKFFSSAVTHVDHLGT